MTRRSLPLASLALTLALAVSLAACGRVRGGGSAGILEAQPPAAYESDPQAESVDAGLQQMDAGLNATDTLGDAAEIWK